MIPLNDFKRQWRDTAAAAEEAFRVFGESGWYVLGREVREFESSLGAYWNLPHAAGVASGLDAIEIALRVLGCGRGDKVLTTPLSAFATTLAIVKTGATPVFVDTDESGGIDLDIAGEVLAARSDIRFFVPVHLYGVPLDLDRLRSIIESTRCVVVEDCAQSIGAAWRGRNTGAIGEAAATSFYPTKNLGALGDGGCVLWRDAEKAQLAASLRDYGQSAKYRHDHIGYNSRLDELQAALLRRVYLPRLGEWTARRREIASRYLACMRNPHVGLLPVAAPAEPCWHLFPVFVESKSAFLSWLTECGIGYGEHYPIPIPDQHALAGAAQEVIGALECTRRLCRTEVSLPIHPYLSDDEVERVIHAVAGYPGL